jgi:hypothetical protein
MVLRKLSERLAGRQGNDAGLADPRDNRDRDGSFYPIRPVTIRINQCVEALPVFRVCYAGFFIETFGKIKIPMARPFVIFGPAMIDPQSVSCVTTAGAADPVALSVRKDVHLKSWCRT